MTDRDMQTARIMERLMKAEGHDLQKVMEALEEDPDLTVPEAIQRDWREAMGLAATDSTKRRSSRFSLRRALRYAVAAALVCVFLFITAYAIVYEVRVRTWQLLEEITGRDTFYTVYPKRELTFQNLPDTTTDTAGNTILGYYEPTVPKGYHRARSETWDCGATLQYNYGETRAIYLTIRSDKEASELADTAGGRLRKVRVNGYPGLFIEKKFDKDAGQYVPEAILLWDDTDRHMALCLRGVNSGSDILWEMAAQMTPGDPALRQVVFGYRMPATPQGFCLQSSKRYSNLITLDYQGELSSFSVQIAHGSYDHLSYLKDPQTRQVDIGGDVGHLRWEVRPAFDGTPRTYTELIWCDSRRGMLLMLEGFEMEADQLLEYARQIEYAGD